MSIEQGKNTGSDREILLEKAYKLAYEYDQKYGSCPQCVIAAIQETLGLSYVCDETFKAAYTMAGGGGLCGVGTCGALAGGILVIGSRFGRPKTEFSGRKPLAFKLSKKLIDRFVAEYGDITCRGVQKRLMGKGFDMWNAEEYRAFELAGGHKDKCPDVSGKVARWAAEIILEEETKKA